MVSQICELRDKIILKEFSRMNQMQLKAVLSIDGPLLILAGAGSGKTTVLVNRIANLIKYGSAYGSDVIESRIDNNTHSLMTEYYEGNDSVYYDIKRALSVDAPKPWEILAFTFTNKAANELKERLVLRIGEEANDIWAGTFHSICLRILRKNADLIGYSSHFTIYDTDDSKRVMKECQRLLNIDDKFLPHKSILSEISRAKDMLVPASEYLSLGSANYREKQIGECYVKYQQLLKNADAMDFDDIIFNTVKLLKENDDVREYYQNKFRYVLVDEYQDTNHAQFMLTKLLSEGYNNICVVGDDDQSIYKFRGATIENILSFEKNFKNAKVIRLEENYRSTQNILDGANAVISNNEQRKGKNLWTSNGKGDKIILNTLDDEYGEGKFIANEIVKSMGSDGKFSDYAVLYRMNSMSNSIERSFVRSGIPYRIIGGHKFYDRMEIKDALAYLSVIANHGDNLRLERIINVPKRGIGATTINAAKEISAALGLSLFEVFRSADEYEKLKRSAPKLQEFTSMIEGFSELLTRESLSSVFISLLDESGYKAMTMADKEKGEERLQNLDELNSNLIRFKEENPEGELSDFLEEVALLTDIDNYNADSDTVVMMTLHASKGLEFPVVFIPGMEEGVFPGMQSLYDSSEIEEERRLAYVGITRAKKKLYLLNTKSRMIFGSTKYNRPSRFLEELPKDCCESLVKIRKPMPSKNQTNSLNTKPITNGFGSGFSSSTNKSTEKFIVGEQVVHRVFGKGMIVSLRPMGNDVLMEIAFEKVGTKKIMANMGAVKKA